MTVSACTFRPGARQHNFACRLSARKGVVISAGAWTGSLLADSFGEDFWRSAFKPRKGHLLELDWPGCGPKLRNGLMELGYTKVYRSERLEDQELTHLTCLKHLQLHLCLSASVAYSC